MLRKIILILAIGLLGPGTSSIARVLEVSGSGGAEYSDIQGAVDGAAPGDTILIGPGRYEAMTEWNFDGWWTRDVLVGVRVDSLTIIGASRDEVILGPELADFVDFGPKGIVVEPSISMIRVENLRVENVYDGFYIASGGLLTECTTSGCRYGASLFGSVGMTIRLCDFEAGYSGVAAFDGTDDLLVEDCLVEPEDAGFRFEGALNSTLRRASVQGGVVGIVVGGSSVLEIFDSAIEGCEFVGLGIDFAFVDVYDSVFGPTGRTIVTNAGGEIRGTGCVFGAGQFITMDLVATTNVDLSSCDIFSEPGQFAVSIVGSEPAGTYQQRMTDCYWGFSDPDSVAGAIWDAVDDPSIGTLVEYLPISASSVKTESVPLGSVKSMFR